MSYWGQDGQFPAGAYNPSARIPREFAGPSGASYNYLLKPSNQSWKPDRVMTTRKPDMTALLRAIGRGGAGGGDGDFSWRRYFEGEMPGQYSEDLSVAELSIDPMEKVRAAEPVIQRKLDRNMADVGMRLGMAGGLTGGGYATELGQEAAAASNEIGSLIANTVYESAENQAAREQQARQNRLDRLFGGWSQWGDWKMRAGENEQAAAEAGLDRYQNQLPYIMDLIGMLQGQGYYASDPSAYAGIFGY